MGRPPKSGKTLTKTDVLAEALRLLDAGGNAALTFKALGAALGITPMAVAHHVGNRKNMMGLLMNAVFKGVETPPTAPTPALRVRELMLRYCERVIRHPGLVNCILGNPELHDDLLKTLTETLRSEILAAGVKGIEADVVLNLIVDYTHGFAFAAAADPEQTLTIDDYSVGVNWLLARIPGNGCTVP